MPGTPDPVLGNWSLTYAVASIVGTVVAVGPYALRENLPAPAAFSLAGGLTYALFCLGVWAGARVATIGFPVAASDRPGLLAVVLGLNALVLGSQVAVPYYLYVRSRFVAPLVGAFAATVLVLTLFLSVGGETDPVALYPVLFGPISVIGIGLLVLAEFGVRRLLLGG